MAARGGRAQGEGAEEQQRRQLDDDEGRKWA